MHKIREGLLSRLPAPEKNLKGWPWDEETDPEIYTNLNQLPKISIVTPSYNQGEFIEQTIRSVLLQNYPNLEYIIIDGGSIDKSQEIIKKYEPWLKFWESKKDKGQTDAINRGLEKCRGEIFNWINSDDFYSKECFKNVAENFDNDKINIVAGTYRYFDEGKEKHEKIIGLKLKPTLEETLAFVLMDQPSTFFRLSIVNELGKLDASLKYIMDQDLWKKYLFGYGLENIKTINEVLAHFRLHGDSKTYNNSFSNEYHRIFYSIALKAGMNAHAELIKKIFNLSSENDYEFGYDFKEKEIKLAKKVINYLIYFNARSLYTSGNYKLSAECMKLTDSQYINDNHKQELRKLKLKLLLIKYKLSFLVKNYHNHTTINQILF